MKIKSFQKIITLHIFLSLLLISLIYSFIIPTWYPSDFSKILVSSEIFTILIFVEIGLITGVIVLLYIGRNNSNKETLIICCLFFALQISAAFIGTKTLYEAKPMYVAYEFDRFRIIRPIDIIWGGEDKKYNFFKGPEFYGTKEYASNNIRLLKSIKDSVNGLHPSFKRERLVPYKNSRADIIKNSKGFATLSNDKRSKVQELVGIKNMDALGYYPLVSYFSDEWIVIINLNDANVAGYVNIDGWGS